MKSYRTEWVDMEAIKKEFLQYAPAYAQDEARLAIQKVSDLQKQGILRNGLYYVVLVDLVGSTRFGAEQGNDALTSRIQYFVRSSFDALNVLRLTNVGLFLKEIGDAVLYVFQHFPDILRWLQSFRACLAVDPPTSEPLVFRACVHIGEVYLDGVNPLSLAVSQVFKMEKAVAGGAVVLTAPAFSAAWPTVARAYHAFQPCGDVGLAGFEGTLQLYQLDTRDQEDLQRIADEDHG